MWHLSVAENPQHGDGVYGALGATPAQSEHSSQGSVERSRSTEQGTSSSRRSDPNEMTRSGADLPQGKESDVNSV